MSDDASEDGGCDVLVRLSLNFKAIKIVKTELIPIEWDFIVDMNFDEDDDQFDIDNKLTQNAIARVKYWIEHIVDGSVIFSNDNKWAKKWFPLKKDKDSVSNNLILLPKIPNTDWIARVLHAKINAIANGYVAFGTMEITSNDNPDLSYYYLGDSSHRLPEMEKWIGPRSFFEEPWWYRNDTSTFDIVPLETDDVSVIPEFVRSLDFINKPPIARRRTKGQLIKPVFKPKIIDGGKQ